MSKGYDSCKATAEGSVTVCEVLDDMPFGRFHIAHLTFAILAVSVLAIPYEMTPYMFPGLQIHFGAGREELSTFAAAFQAGCAFGTFVAPVLADRIGRKPTLTFSLTAAALLSYASATARSLHMLLVLRTVSSAIWAIAWNTVSPWYIEFLPTRTRGAMLTALSLGWPVGRGISICCSNYFHSDWQKLQELPAIAMLLLAIGTRFIHESPRFLAARGRTDEARQVLQEVHRSNGSEWNSKCQLCLDDSSTQSMDERTWQELFSPDYVGRIAFCWTLFSLLSCTTILIDTWGPLIYQHLLFPHRTVLPHGLLMLFNVGDFVGLIISVCVIDFIGRKGGFVVGFFVQGCILLTLSGVHGQAHRLGHYSLYVQSMLGVMAASCRSFAWEGAVMWTLEAFPTPLRTAALCSSRVFMQLMAVLTLKVSADYLANYAAVQWLQLFGGCLFTAGVIVTIFNPQETAGQPLAEGGARSRVASASRDSRSSRTSCDQASSP